MQLFDLPIAAESEQGATDRFNAGLGRIIRDCCHAYLALADRNDWSVCIKTLHDGHADLAALCDAPTAFRPAKVTGIGKESTLRAISSVVQAGERLHETLLARLENPAMLPDDVTAWVNGDGRKTLQGMAFILADLFSEKNVREHILRMRQDVH